MSSHKIIVGFTFAAALSFGLPAAGHATTYTLDTNYCSGGCTVPAGTVTAITEGSGLDITVSLTSSNQDFRNNFAASFAFDLQNLPVGGSVQISQDATDLLGTNGALTWSQVTNTGHMDGIGSWNYGLTYTCAHGNCNNGSTLEFDVTDTAGTLTLANLAQGADNNGNPLWFVADVSNADGTNTGFVGASVTATPLPGTFALFGSVLFGGLGVLGWSKRRAQGSVSATA